MRIKDMTPQQRNAYADQLRGQGFDRVSVDNDEGTIGVRCSQCEVLVIQGMPTHETGCPHASGRRR